jgi:hypothetical protein
MKAQGSHLLAESGWYLIGTAANSTIKHYGFMPTEDTVIDSWDVTDSGGIAHNMVTYFGLTSQSTVITTSHPALIIPASFRNSGTHSIKLHSGAGVLLREG